MLTKIIKSSILFLLICFSVSQVQAAFLTPVRISLDDLGDQGNGDSVDPSISGDGRYVTFYSSSTDLVAGVDNGFNQIYIYDTTNNTIEAISLASGGAEGNGNSENPFISSNAQYVVFESEATNLVAGDTNGVKDIFRYKVSDGSITRVSLDNLGTELDAESTTPSISSDGNRVVFVTSSAIAGDDTNTAEDVYLRDISGDETILISRIPSDATTSGNAASTSPLISSDGSSVTFYSTATNLVSGDTNSRADIFFYNVNLNSGAEIASLTDGEALGNNNVGFLSHMSSNGRYVLFESDATNLVSGDTNALRDVFVRDTTLDTTTRVNISSAGTQSSGGASGARGISTDGRFVLMSSNASNLVSGDTNDFDYFLYDRDYGEMDLVTIGASIGADDIASLSSDGSAVVYNSEATNLVSGDSNGTFDVFYAKVEDEDGISRTVEIAAPNDGDIDSDGYVDSLEAHITSFVSDVTSDYVSILTSGNCTNNLNPTILAEDDLDDQDSSYSYPLGVFDFNITCDSSGQSADVTLYYFEPTLDITDLVARKYNGTTGEYTTIDSAVIEETTIDGERAITVEYTVTDGGELDEDGSADGTILDPVGLGSFVPPPVVEQTVSQSSGSRSKKTIALENINKENSVNEKICHPFTTLIKKGSKYGEVSKLQEILNSKGFNSGVVDGLFGPMTDKAVKAFQSSNMLISDGIVGPMTRAVLNKCI